MTFRRHFPASVRISRHFFSYAGTAAAALVAGVAAVKVPSSESESGGGGTSEDLLTDDGTKVVKKKDELMTEQREKRFGKTKHSTPDFRHIVVTDEVQTRRNLWDIPVAPIGMVATVIALIYMFRSSYRGSQRSLLLSMQYRIIAQFVTVISLAVGTLYLKFKEERENNAK